MFASGPTVHMIFRSPVIIAEVAGMCFGSSRNMPADAREQAVTTQLVLEMIHRDPKLSAIYHEVRQRMHCDSAHDFAHLLRVASWALRLGGSDVSPQLAIAAALLHDVVNVSKDDPRRGQASELCAVVAREIMAKLGFSEAEVTLVADAVRDHSFSRGAIPETPLGRALQDADRLEALGVLGVFRCIATGVRMNATFFDADDPWAENRDLDDKRFSVDHFYTKLLRLPESFLTEAGRIEAEHRASVMRTLLMELGREIGRPEPDTAAAREHCHRASE